MSARDRGRPKTSSLAALEDAAHELFLEQGYEGTSIDDIARRAGISRATFFNYFASKSDVLWVDVDHALSGLEHQLHHADHLGDALRAVAAKHPRDRIPLVVTQSEAMGLGADLAASAGIRLECLRRILAGSRVDASDAWIVLGALVGALHQWATHQAPRPELGDALEEGLDRIRQVLGSRSVATLF
jgi:AcrR family transcriptional regulator